MPGPESPQSHLTRLKAITAAGEHLLTTEDQAVQEKVLAAGDESKSFVYWTGERNEIVTGRVTSATPSEPFEFTVLAESAGEGP